MAGAEREKVGRSRATLKGCGLKLEMGLKKWPGAQAVLKVDIVAAARL